MIAHLTQQAKAWSAPRHLFDAAIEYLSGKKIAIPAYSTLQKIISQVVSQEQDQLIARVGFELSQDLKHALTTLGTVLEKLCAPPDYVQLCPSPMEPTGARNNDCRC